jgi:hypothetical protein
MELIFLLASLYEKTDRQRAEQIYRSLCSSLSEEHADLSLFCFLKVVELYDLNDKVNLLLSEAVSLEELFENWKELSTDKENTFSLIVAGLLLFHVIQAIDDSQSLPLKEIFKSLQTKELVSDCRWNSFRASSGCENYQDSLAKQALTSKHFPERDLRRKALYASHFFKNGLENADNQLHNKNMLRSYQIVTVSCILSGMTCFSTTHFCK